MGIFAWNENVWAWVLLFVLVFIFVTVCIYFFFPSFFDRILNSIASLIDPAGDAPKFDALPRLPNARNLPYSTKIYVQHPPTGNLNRVPNSPFIMTQPPRTLGVNLNRDYHADDY